MQYAPHDEWHLPIFDSIKIICYVGQELWLCVMRGSRVLDNYKIAEFRRSSAKNIHLAEYLRFKPTISKVTSKPNALQKRTNSSVLLLLQFTVYRPG
jgi:hypothetical protein